MGPVSNWMGDPHSSAIGCCSRAVRGEALNCWVRTDKLTNKNFVIENKAKFLSTKDSTLCGHYLWTHGLGHNFELHIHNN